MTFCTDVDLLAYEPNVFVEARAAAADLWAGARPATLCGPALTFPEGDAGAAVALPGHVVVVELCDDGGGVARRACLPIEQVDGPRALRLALHHREWRFRSCDVPRAARASLRTFWPQRRAVTATLAARLGLDGRAAADLARRLRVERPVARACALGTLHLVYAGLAAGLARSVDLDVRAQLYERSYRRALRGLSVPHPHGRPDDAPSRASEATANRDAIP